MTNTMMLFQNIQQKGSSYCWDMTDSKIFSISFTVLRISNKMVDEDESLKTIKNTGDIESFVESASTNFSNFVGVSENKF